jgi:hypothetical protein
MAKHSLSSKHFFTLVVLSVAVLGTMLMTFASQQKTNTRSEATGAPGKNLDQCSQLSIESGKPNRDYGGGVQLFNGDIIDGKPTGGDRVFCVVKLPGSISRRGDRNLSEDNRKPNEQIYQDIWGDFNFKTNSLSIRADSYCMTSVYLYKSVANYDEDKYFTVKEVNNYYYPYATTEHFQLNDAYKDKTVAIYVTVNCSK